MGRKSPYSNISQLKTVAAEVCTADSINLYSALQANTSSHRPFPPPPLAVPWGAVNSVAAVPSCYGDVTVTGVEPEQVL